MSATIWLTGFSASGKSTLAAALAVALAEWDATSTINESPDAPALRLETHRIDVQSCIRDLLGLMGIQKP